MRVICNSEYRLIHVNDIKKSQIKERIMQVSVEAMAEIKATVDGGSDQKVRDIVYGAISEIQAINNSTTPEDH